MPADVKALHQALSGHRHSKLVRCLHHRAKYMLKQFLSCLSSDEAPGCHSGSHPSLKHAKHSNIANPLPPMLAWRVSSRSGSSAGACSLRCATLK